MTNIDKKLMQLKAEQRAKTLKDEQLRELIESSSSSIEDIALCLALSFKLTMSLS